MRRGGVEAAGEVANSYIGQWGERERKMEGIYSGTMELGEVANGWVLPG